MAVLLFHFKNRYRFPLDFDCVGPNTRMKRPNSKRTRSFQCGRGPAPPSPEGIRERLPPIKCSRILSNDQTGTKDVVIVIDRGHKRARAGGPLKWG